MKREQLYCDTCPRQDGFAHFRLYDTYLVDVAGSRDDVCSICHDPIIDGQELLLHGPCQHVTHRECIRTWIISATEVNLPCGFCRKRFMNINYQNLARLANIPETIFELDTRLDVSRLHKLMQDGIPIHFVARANLLRSFEAGELPIGFAEYLFEHPIFEGSHHGKFRHRLLPPGDRIHGSQLFHYTDSTEAGAFVIRHCKHQKEYILMSPLAVSYTIPSLYSQGWDPVTGKKGPKLQLWNADWIYLVLDGAKNFMKTHGLDQLYLPPCLIASTLRNSLRMRKGHRLMIEMNKVNWDPDWIIVAIAAYKLEQGHIQLLSHTEALEFVKELGGIDLSMKVVPLENLVQERIDAYEDIIKPFPKRSDTVEENTD